MLGRKSSKENTSNMTNSSGSASSNAINSLVFGTKAEGTITTINDIRIDGQLTGTLDCKGRVIIGPKGFVEGDINCQNAIIEGVFKGKLKVDELLNVRENARIDGDIEASKLLVQSGAVLNVNCKMGGQKVSSLSNSNGKKEAVLSFDKK